MVIFNGILPISQFMREILKLYSELSFWILGTWYSWNSFIISAPHLPSIRSLLVGFFLHLLIYSSTQTGFYILLQFSGFALGRWWWLCFFRINFLFVLNFQLFLLSQRWKYIYTTCYTHFLICGRWLQWWLHNEFTWRLDTL